MERLEGWAAYLLVRGAGGERFGFFPLFVQRALGVGLDRPDFLAGELEQGGEKDNVRGVAFEQCGVQCVEDVGDLAQIGACLPRGLGGEKFEYGGQIIRQFGAA